MGRSASERGLHRRFALVVDPKVLNIQKACRLNIDFFASTYVKTEDPQAEDPVRDWPDFGYLKTFFAMVEANAILTVYKRSRQMMLSWAACVLAIWYSAFNPSRLVMIQSIKEDAAKALISRIEFILLHFPPWLLPCEYSITASTVTFFHTAGKSKIKAVPSGANQIRSFSPTIVIFDESAWQDDIKKAHATAAPAVRGGGKVVHISTPGEASEPCAEFFKSMVKGGTYRVLELHYSMMPGTGGEWKDKIKKLLQMSDADWDREMEGSFDVGSGKPVFKPPFTMEEYVCPIGYNPALELLIGVDYGVRHPAAVWFQYIPYTYQVYFLLSMTGDNVTLSYFAQEIIKATKELIHPVAYTKRLNLRMFDDPAGCSRKDTGGPTSRQAMNTAGLFPVNSSKKIRIKESVSLIRERLVKRAGMDMKVRPGCLFDPKCENLIAGMNGKYSEDEKIADKYKGGITQHEVDAARYGLSGILRLGDK
ncbi:MAG TPA: hypothetical protein VMW79_01600 [Anaerolineae bacterium]|nr:hypothetical protein [Anaerolineae bacterium]